MKTELAGQGRITKRLVVCLLGMAVVYWSLKVHRDWVWAYFESVLVLTTDNPGLTNVATASISALTTAFIAFSTVTAAIVLFLVTGNVAAIQSMFKFGSVAQVTGETISESINDVRNEKVEVIRGPKAEYFDDIP